MIELVLAALVDPTADLKQQIKEDPAMGAYVLCIAKKAGELEQSGEAADSVATATVLACDQLADFAAEMEVVKFDGEGQRKGETPLTAFEHQRMKAGALKVFREKARALAITRVVTMRAEH